MKKKTLVYQTELFRNLNRREPVYNPMVIKYGHGPEGKRCKDCGHLYYKQFAKRYYKCELRGDTHSARTDHRVRWCACKLFVPENPENETQ